MDLLEFKTLFLRYLLLPLIMIIMIFVLGTIMKKIPNIKWKQILVYILIFSGLLGLFGFTSALADSFIPYLYLIVQVLAIILGGFNVRVIRKRFTNDVKSVIQKRIFESLITAICCLLGGYIFFLIFQWVGPKTEGALMSATSIVTFGIPLLFFYTHVAISQIPYGIYKTWNIETEKTIYDFKGINFDQLIVLNVELSKKASDKQRFTIKAKSLPTEITFGQWFHRLLSDYNMKYPSSKIEVEDMKGQPYDWIFYVKRSVIKPRTYIDFEKDIEGNEIKEKQIIICKRVFYQKEES